MSSNADTIRMYWEACWNERRIERLVEVFADPYTHGRTPFSPELHAEIIRDAFVWFPDLHIEVDELEDQGDTIITRSRFIGTHGGEIYGLSPTGRLIEAPSLDVYFFADGKVIRLWHLFDHLPILKGIGAEVRIGDQLAVLD